MTESIGKAKLWMSDCSQSDDDDDNDDDDNDDLLFRKSSQGFAGF